MKISIVLQFNTKTTRQVLDWYFEFEITEHYVKYDTIYMTRDQTQPHIFLFRRLWLIYLVIVVTKRQ